MGQGPVFTKQTPGASARTDYHAPYCGSPKERKTLSWGASSRKASRRRWVLGYTGVLAVGGKEGNDISRGTDMGHAWHVSTKHKSFFWVQLLGHMGSDWWRQGWENRPRFQVLKDLSCHKEFALILDQGLSNCNVPKNHLESFLKFHTPRDFDLDELGLRISILKSAFQMILIQTPLSKMLLQARGFS